MRELQLRLVGLIVFVSVLGLIIFWAMLLLFLFLRGESASEFFVPVAFITSFIVAFLSSVSLGLALGIRLSHRVAGGLYRLLRHLDRWGFGDLRDDVQLRSDDLILAFGEQFRATLEAKRRLVLQDRQRVQCAERDLKDLQKADGLPPGFMEKIREIGDRLAEVGGSYRLPEGCQEVP